MSSSIRTLRLLFVFLLAAVLSQAQSCPYVASTYNETYNAVTNIFDPKLDLFECSCSDQDGVPVGLGYCLAATRFGIEFFLRFQNDTLDYKWYPAWGQTIDDPSGGSFEANPSCTIESDASIVDVENWVPEVGYNATSKFQLNQRCNIAANYCVVTGQDCIVSSSGDSSQFSAFNIKGVACTSDYQGEAFWGIANVLVQWKHYSYEQCWQSTIATPQQGSGRGSSASSDSGATRNTPALAAHLALSSALLLCCFLFLN